MSADTPFLDRFPEEIKKMTDYLEFIDARVKVAQKQNETDILVRLHQHKTLLKLLQQSADILLQRLENDNLRDNKGRKKTDSGFESANSDLLAVGLVVESAQPYRVDMAALVLEHPIQETESPNPSQSEHYDLSPKDGSDEGQATCSSV